MHARIVTMFIRATRVVGAAMMFALPITTVSRTRADANVRLYTLDCGYAEFKDFGLGSDTGDYDGRPAELVDPCFLIKHPKGWLLWDAGLPVTLPRSVSGGVAPQDMLAKLGFRTWIAPPLTRNSSTATSTSWAMVPCAFSRHQATRPAATRFS